MVWCQSRWGALHTRVWTTSYWPSCDGYINRLRGSRVCGGDRAWCDASRDGAHCIPGSGQHHIGRPVMAISIDWGVVECVVVTENGVMPAVLINLTGNTGWTATMLCGRWRPVSEQHCVEESDGKLWLNSYNAVRKMKASVRATRDDLTVSGPVTSRAPSQYKDRLIYIWRFPC